MGIEPTVRCSRTTGFEDRGSHQAAIASVLTKCLAQFFPGGIEKHRPETPESDQRGASTAPRSPQRGLTRPEQISGLPVGGVSQRAIDTMLIDNPRRHFEGSAARFAARG